MESQNCYTGGNPREWDNNIDHVIYMHEKILPNILTSETKRVHRFTGIHPDFPQIRGISEQHQIADTQLLQRASDFIVNHTMHVNIEKATARELKSLRYHADVFDKIKALTARLETWKAYKTLLSHTAAVQKKQNMYTSTYKGKRKQTDKETFEVYIEYKNYKDLIEQGMEEFDAASKASSIKEGKKYNNDYNPNIHVNFLLFKESYKIGGKRIQEFLAFHDQLWENTMIRILHKLFAAQPPTKTISTVEEINNGIVELKTNIESGSPDWCAANLETFCKLSSEISDLTALLNNRIAKAQQNTKTVPSQATKREISPPHSATEQPMEGIEITLSLEQELQEADNKEPILYAESSTKVDEQKAHSPTTTRSSSSPYQMQDLRSANNKDKNYPPGNLGYKPWTKQVQYPEYLCPCCNERTLTHQAKNNKKFSKSLEACPVFERMSYYEKRKTIYKFGICSRCLIPGHFLVACKYGKTCDFCGNNHHTLICGLRVHHDKRRRKRQQYHNNQ